MDVHKESEHEWTFRVASDVCPAHGQFMQLSIPKIGEAPISVSAQGEGWLEFTNASSILYTIEIWMHKDCSPLPIWQRISNIFASSCQGSASVLLLLMGVSCPENLGYPLSL